MPELPEVEVTKKALCKTIKNKYIKETNVFCSKLRYDIPHNIQSIITNKKVLNIIRRAKYLVVVFDKFELLMHLGMSGKITLGVKDEMYHKHDHFELIFDNITLRFNDPRRFGCILITDDYKKHKLIKNLGIEPLTKNFVAKYLFNKSRQKICSIKSFITDSSVVVGIGNIYACESLFLAQINPMATAKSVSFKKYQALTKHIKQTLQKAINCGGTTLKDFRNTDGSLGYFKQQLKIYGRDNENCNTCGQQIKRVVQNQRSTFYCSYCQK